MNLTFNESQIDLDLSFADIMTSKVLFYNASLDAHYSQFCAERNIEYLPSSDEFGICYRLNKDTSKFIREKIEDSQKVKVEEDLFDKSILEKFKTYQVLFVYRNNELVGVVHFCDYNRFPVFIYVYSLILIFETRFRNLLTNNGLSNTDMIEFFKIQSINSGNSKTRMEYMKKLGMCLKRDEAIMKELEPFQCFYLYDLIKLAKFKNIINISESVNNLRNIVMHAKNPVKHKNYEFQDLIYNLDSFRDFFGWVELLQSELRNVTARTTPSPGNRMALLTF